MGSVEVRQGAQGPALRGLAERIQGILRAPGPGSGAGSGVLGAGFERVPTGWDGVDRALGGGLVRGALHEWFGIGCPGDGPLGSRSSGGRRPVRGDWAPPLSLAIHLAWQMLEFVAGHQAFGQLGGGRVLWIGREVWPYPRAMVRDFGVCAGRTPEAVRRDADPIDGSDGANEAEPIDVAEVLHTELLELVRWPIEGELPPRHLIDHSLLVDARSVQERLWALDSALRCPSVVAVIADGRGFDMAATRRLQLAAEVGRGWGLLLRPPGEARGLSAAGTRWRVERCAPVGGAARPRWMLGLTRSKGLSPFGDTLTR